MSNEPGVSSKEKFKDVTTLFLSLSYVNPSWTPILTWEEFLLSFNFTFLPVIFDIFSSGIIASVNLPLIYFSDQYDKFLRLVERYLDRS